MTEPQTYEITLDDLAISSGVGTFRYACIYHDGPKPRFPFPRLYRWSPRFLRRLMAQYARYVGHRRFGPWFVDLEQTEIALP